MKLIWCTDEGKMLAYMECGKTVESGACVKGQLISYT